MFITEAMIAVSAFCFRVSQSMIEPEPASRDLNVNGRHGILSPRLSSAVSDLQARISTSSSSGEESDGEVAGPSRSQPSPEHMPRLNDHSRINLPKPLITSSLCDPENTRPSSLGMAAFRDPSSAVKSNASRNRQRQLESLRRMEERIRSLSRTGSGSNISVNNVPAANNPNTNTVPSVSPKSHTTARNVMTMFVLDISHVLSDDCYSEWLPQKTSKTCNAEPEEKILYTLIAGKGELIMFGGIQKDATSITSEAQLPSSVTNTVSNSLHFVTAPSSVI
jgi:F-box protein 42